MKRWLVAICLLALTAPAPGQEPRPVSDADFPEVLKMIRWQRGEWNWAEVPWLIHMTDAQQTAMSEGKPILMATAAQGSICGYL
ncbi:MAG: hypothetical protein ACJ8F7_13000 [Gemmataceae bacterium]